MSPSPSTAVPSETTATVLRLIVYWNALSGSSAIAMHTRATPGRVGHREVVARLQRMLVVLLDLAAHVQQESAVGGVDHLAPRELVDRREDRSQCSLPGGVDHDVAHAVPGVDLDEVHGADHPARVADRARHPPSMPCSSSILTRMVSRYWALGVTLTCVCSSSFAAAGHAPGGDGTGAQPRRVARARGWHAPRQDAPATIGSGHGPRRVMRASAGDGPAEGDGAEQRVPDRRPQPRLPGLLRAARVDRHLHRRAHQRDLRVRLDAREDRHRLRGVPDDRGVGRRQLRAHARCSPSTRPSGVAPGPAQGAVAGDGTAGRRVRLPQRQGRGLRGRRRHRLAGRAGPRRPASR